MEKITYLPKEKEFTFRRTITGLIERTNEKVRESLPDVTSVVLTVGEVGFLYFGYKNIVLDERVEEVLERIAVLPFDEHKGMCLYVSSDLVRSGLATETASVIPTTEENIRGAKYWHVIAGIDLGDTYIFIDGTWPSIDITAREDGFPYGIVVAGKSRDDASFITEIVYGDKPHTPLQKKPNSENWIHSSR